jgi:hypothetical protein
MAGDRVSGSVMIFCNAILIVTAFGLYYLGSETLRPLISDLHIIIGLALLWVDVLGKVRAFIGGWAIALSWKDSVAKRGGSYFEEGGQDSYYHQLYFEKYIKLDPFTTTQFVVEIEEPKSFLEVIP